VAVVSLDIQSRRPHGEGLDLAQTGPYERLDGIIRFSVDPDDELNDVIVDLDKAPRDVSGRVTFWSDFTMLKPVDSARGNRRLLFEVLNRGRKNIPRHLDRAPSPSNPTTDEILVGDGFLLRHGYTVVWCGWQWDVIRSPALMGLNAPLAMEDGKPVGGQAVVQFQPNDLHYTHLLADRVHQPYPAANLVDTSAVLIVQDYQEAPATIVPRHQWSFGREQDGRVVPDNSHIYLATGFEPGRLYTLTYQTSLAPVVGVGLLAVRDCVSFLRYAKADTGNPVAGAIDRTYGFGVSQSGRFLRHYLYLGLNLDEERRPVFDGVIPHVAGARRGEFNHRFAQPSVQFTPGFGHLFPFADEPHTDPNTGQHAGLLDRQKKLGSMPKIFYTNTSAEYWRGDASLLTLDPNTNQDIFPPDNVRVYLFASTQHGPGGLPLSDTNANDGCRGRHWFNILDYSPLNRAALANMDAWVSNSTTPPPSAYPRRADGTAVLPGQLGTTFENIPGATFPDPSKALRISSLDLGPLAAQGIGRYPAKMGPLYPNYVSSVDADGNEVAGVRMPDLNVPVTSYTGWNPRHPATGGAGQIIPMQGSTFPFARTNEERRDAQDPRPSIAARYANKKEYLAQVRAAAEDLVARRYLLAEDIGVVIENAAERYDYFAG
jgi:hypothetical protein